MELFMPSQRILEVICDPNPLYSYEVYKRQEPQRLREELLRSFMSGIHARIAGFYKVSFDAHRLRGSCILSVAGEAMKNCLDHGPQDKEVVFGMFLGKEGVCYGFNDGGDYFKQEAVKKQYESKTPLTNLREQTEDNYRHGVNWFIFPESDLIEVDTTKGILYCVQLKDRLIGN
jgi:hypothetical protein